MHFLAQTSTRYYTLLISNHYSCTMALYLKRLVSGKKARYRDDQLNLELGMPTTLHSRVG